MVAVSLPELSYPQITHRPPPQDAARAVRCPTADPRGAGRIPVAAKVWAMRPSGTERGYALDLSETGARLGGISSRFVIGQGLLLKIDLGDQEGPIILRAEAIRWHEPEGGGARQLAVRFLEIPFDDWFRLVRLLDQQS